MRTSMLVTLGLVSLSLAPLGEPTFQVLSIPLGAPAQRLAVGSLDGDGVSDAVVVLGTSSGEASLLVMRGLGNGRFVSESLDPLVELGYFERPDVLLADLNGDGVLDVGLSAVNQQVRLGVGDLGFTPMANFPTFGGSQFALGLSDRDADGDLDSTLLVRDISQVYLDFGENDGSGQFTDPEATIPLVGDLIYADADMDGAEEPYVVGGSGLLHGTTGTRFATGQFGEVIAAAFDGQGAPDLAVADMRRGGVRLLHNDGTGSFPTTTFVATGRRPESLAAGDMTNDGVVDLVVANRVAATVTLLVGDGAGSFTQASTTSVPADPLDLELADVDVDGDLDVILATGSSQRLVVLLNTPAP